MLIIVPETNPQITMPTKTHEAYCPNKIYMDFFFVKDESYSRIAQFFSNSFEKRFSNEKSESVPGKKVNPFCNL
jgi:hypothetical protein